MATDIERMIDFEISKFKESRQIEAPYWLAPLATAITNIPIQRQKAAIFKRNDLNAQVESLDSLAKLITNKAGVDNIVKLSTNISSGLKEIGLDSKAAVVDQFATNISSNHDMYVNSMEQGASFIDDPNFITDMSGWDDLEHTVAKMTLEDGKTKKYEGNGSFLFLTEQNDKINSIISRIQNSSQGTQFKYNKAGNKYTDDEMIDKLTQHQKRLGVALEASMGDGIITKEEAESIMLGNLDAYQDRKRDALKRIDREYNMLNKLQISLSKEARALTGKSAVLDINLLTKQITNELNDIQGDENIIDTDISAATPEGVVKKLREQIQTIHGEKVRLKASFKGWSGEDWSTIAPKEGLPKGANIYVESDLGPYMPGQEDEFRIPLAPTSDSSKFIPPEEVELKYSPVHDPGKISTVDDGSKVGITDSDWSIGKTVATGALFYGLSQPEQVEKGIKTAVNFAAQGSRYINSVTQFSADQITKFLGHSSTQATLDHIAREEAKMASLKADGKVGTEAYVKAKDKIAQIIKNRSNYWANRFKVDKKHVDRLWKTKEGRGKWSRIFKLKSDIKNKYPKLFKSIYEGKKLPKTVKTVKAVGKLGRAYVPWKMGEIVSDALGAEGFKALGIQATTAGSVTLATRKFWPKAASMAKSPQGRAALLKIFGKTIAPKVIKGVTTGKHPVLATILGTAGGVWGAIDAYNAIKDWTE